MNSPAPENTYIKNSFLFNTLIASGAFLCIYAYMIFRFSITGDELFDITNADPSFYVATDRWGVTLFRLLMSDVMAPITYGLFSAACIGLAIALQIRLFVQRDTTSWSAGSLACISIFYTAVHLGIYQLRSILVFSYHADAVCLGYLLMTVGYAAYRASFSKNQRLCILAAVLCFTLGSSVYQTLLILPCIFYIADLMYDSAKAEKKFCMPLFCRKTIILGGIILTSLLLYVTVLLTWKSAIDSTYIDGIALYRQGCIAWQNAEGYTIANYGKLILHIIYEISCCLIGGGFKTNWFYATAIIPVIFLLRHIWKVHEDSRPKLLGIACVLGLWILPFSPIVIFGWTMGGRPLFAPPCACALLWCLCLTTTSGMLRRIPAWFICATSAILIIKTSYTVTQREYRSKLAYEASQKLRDELKQRAWHTPVPDGVDVFSCPIVVIGQLQNHPIAVMEQIQTAAGSYLPSETPIQHSMLPFNTQISSTSQLPPERLEEELRSMDIYPAKGSCRYVEGEIIVRLK